MILTESFNKLLFVLVISTSLLTGCTRRSYPVRSSYASTGYISQRGILEKPFQVIFSENSYLDDSIELENLDFIPAFGKITVKEGYLILAHFSGYMFEFERETEISLEALNIEVSKKLNLSGEPVSRINCGIFYEQIPQKLSPVGAVTICFPQPISIMWGEINTISAANPIVYLRWANHLEEKMDSTYMIQILNIFDDQVGEIVVQGYFACLDLKNYMEEDPLLLIRVTDAKDPMTSSSTVGIKFGSQDFLIPNNCEIKAPAEVLEHAFYYETILEYDLALEFYDLAVSVSDKGIFKIFRENFVARNKGFLNAF